MADIKARAWFLYVCSTYRPFNAIIPEIISLCSGNNSGIIRWPCVNMNKQNILVQAAAKFLLNKIILFAVIRRPTVQRADFGISFHGHLLLLYSLCLLLVQVKIAQNYFLRSCTLCLILRRNNFESNAMSFMKLLRENNLLKYGTGR